MKEYEEEPNKGKLMLKVKLLLLSITTFFMLILHYTSFYGAKLLKKVITTVYF